MTRVVVVARTPKLRIPLAMMALVGTLSFNFQVLLPLLASFTWDGTDDLGERAPAGNYKLEVVATVAGKSQSLSPMVETRVASVTSRVAWQGAGARAVWLHR